VPSCRPVSTLARIAGAKIINRNVLTLPRDAAAVYVFLDIEEERLFLPS
jgi:hypothetical protein